MVSESLHHNEPRSFESLAFEWGGIMSKSMNNVSDIMTPWPDANTQGFDFSWQVKGYGTGTCTVSTL